MSIKGKFLSSFSKPFKWFTDAPLKIALPIIFAVSLLLNLYLEICQKRDILSAFGFAFSSPFIFLANVLIIFATLTLCLLVRRRVALITFVILWWIAMGITNVIVMSFRSSPLSAIDFLIIKDALNVLGAYFSIIEIVLLSGLIIAAIGAVVFLFVVCPKSKINYLKSGAAVLSAVLLGLGAVYVNSKAAVSNSDLLSAYNEKGFVYCFSQSIFVHGVDKPDDELVNKKDKLMEYLSSESNKYGVTLPGISDNLSAPNIVLVQLESFFDVKHIKGIEYSKDPIPNFTSLKENGVSGFLQVPHIGGGTANIEFEVLTGMNLNHFGLGEFPFTTVLKSRACETLATNLRELDYKSHAIHNHIATFYGRNNVYPNLGFDTFTSIEMMEETKRNILGWASDSILVGEIESALNSTEGQDFVFAISVQGHGGYPDHSVEHIYPITEEYVDVYGFEDEKIYYQYHFYCNLIRQMDEAVGAICDMLEKRGEPYVAIFYGDHLPAIHLTASQLDNGDMHQTEYAIKTNLDLLTAHSVQNINELDRNIETYQLAAYIQDLFGMSVGDITLLHQHEFDVGEMFDDILQTLEYEQLYEDEPMYKATDITFGTMPIIFESYSTSGNTVYINGYGFNRYSKVKIDGALRATEFVDEYTLIVKNVFFDSDEIEVVQVADDGTELSYAKKGF